ncbi:MAG: hypothetical protein PHG58_10470 [Clostridia bacterium]|nr:hypothetical protein [Clostridia bacterium]
MNITNNHDKGLAVSAQGFWNEVIELRLEIPHKYGVYGAAHPVCIGSWVLGGKKHAGFYTKTYFGYS